MSIAVKEQKGTTEPTFSGIVNEALPSFTISDPARSSKLNVGLAKEQSFDGQFRQRDEIDFLLLRSLARRSTSGSGRRR